MPGYRDAHVYPLTPDPVKATQLATGGRTAVLYTCNVSPCPEQAQIVKNDLAAIGLRVEIKKFPLGTLFVELVRSPVRDSISHGAAGPPTFPTPTGC